MPQIYVYASFGHLHIPNQEMNATEKRWLWFRVHMAFI